MKRLKVAAAAAVALAAVPTAAQAAQSPGLWSVYDRALSKARHIDLTHRVTPVAPVWRGFGPATFRPTVNPETGQPYTYARDGFEATSYVLSTDQFGTQLDPPAHWAPEFPAIDELPPTYAVRPLVVINVAPQVRKEPTYFLKVSDVRAFERKRGRIPAGSVVMVRSDWHKRWTDDPEGARALAASRDFPSVGLAALKFLHRKRHILFHGHEPLDTDTTPTLEGEHWLMHHGYAQAEGVANLDDVPATGCLVNMGFPRFRGGLGGYARYVAICPPRSTRNGTRIPEVEGPLPAADPLHWDATLGYRVR